MTVLTRSAFAAPFVLLALLNVGLLAPATPSQAQSPQAASGHSGDGGGLGLSAAQRARADARQAQFQKEVTALRADTKLTDAQKQAKYKLLYGAMDKDMLAVLSPAQRTQVLKQRQINDQFQKDVIALRDDKSMTDAQKKARYVQIVKTARNASLALLSPTQRTEALKRSAAAEKIQQQQIAKGAQAKSLSQQLQKSETPAQSEKLRTIGLTTGSKIQTIIADKSLSSDAKTAKIIALRKDALSRDLALLTSSQRTLYERIQALVVMPSGPH